MAIWQFTFYWAPRDVIERLHGPDAAVLAAFQPVKSEAWNESEETPDYWEGRLPLSYSTAIRVLLPSRTSWSQRALMFGDEECDSVELWEDGVRIRLDMRRFNERLARALVGLAARDDLVLVMAETGRLIAPAYDKVVREIANSRASKFVKDPVSTLRMIGRE